jgi:hypothetical protein
MRGRGLELPEGRRAAWHADEKSDARGSAPHRPGIVDGAGDKGANHPDLVWSSSRRRYNSFSQGFVSRPPAFVPIIVSELIAASAGPVIGLYVRSAAPRARVSAIAAGAEPAEQILGDVKALDIRFSGKTDGD